MKDKIKVVIEINTAGKISNVRCIHTEVLAEIYNAILKELTLRLKKK